MHLGTSTTGRPNALHQLAWIPQEDVFCLPLEKVRIDMGGSGGGGYTVSPRPGKPESHDEDFCRPMTFTTNLRPQEGGPVHQKGAVFRIVPTKVGDGTAFVAVDMSSEVVGTIVERIHSLQRCTDLGISYEAEVQDMSFDTHTVKVRATSDGGR